MDKEAHKDGQDRAAALPEGNLRRYYTSPESPELKRDLSFIERKSRALSKRAEAGLGTLGDEGFMRALGLFEEVSERAARVAAYADISLSRDAQAASWAVPVRARLGAAAAAVTPFTRAILDMDEAEILGRAALPGGARHAAWIGRTRALKAHTLSSEAEEYIEAKTAVAEAGWGRFYDATMEGLSMDVRGKKTGFADVDMTLKTGADRSLRREAWTALTAELKKNERAFALILNALADLKKRDDARRDFENPEDARHARNRMDGDIVAAFAEAARADDPKSTHRYYAWKAKKMGRVRLHPADRIAPLPGIRAPRYTWEEAREIVISAYAGFSPRLGALAKKMFDEDRVDAAPRAGKERGHHFFAATPEDGPFIVTNFRGSARDVQALGRETGRAIHVMLAAKRGALATEAPLVVAETAAAVGETLTFRAMYERAGELQDKRALLAARVEETLGSVSRQVSLYTFEQKMHAEYREDGELSPGRISEIWLDTQRAARGPSVDMDAKGAEILWAAVPHFFHAPFYVYAYALDDALAARILDGHARARGGKNAETFTQKYEEMLSLGGTAGPERSFAVLGLDMSAEKFWEKSFVAGRYVDALLDIDAAIEGKTAPKLGPLFGAAVKDAPPAEAPPTRKRAMGRSV